MSLEDLTKQKVLCLVFEKNIPCEHSQEPITSIISQTGALTGLLANHNPPSSKVLQDGPWMEDGGRM